MTDYNNVSSDLLWEICRPYNAYLVKNKTGGGSQFSKDPLNLLNKHSRKHSGFVNNKAVGVQSADNGGLTLITKKTKQQNRPSASSNKVTWAGNPSGPKIYKGIVNYTAKQNYRADLRQEAVARASAVRQSQRTKKDIPEKKLRGSKAKAAAETNL
ncbi:MAG: hypothetical protein Q9167_001751 [Letrouitia subvulpina]